MAYNTRSLQAIALALAAIGCGTEQQQPTPPEAAVPDSVPTGPAAGFSWGTATPESQGMCGSTIELGCTSTLDQIWSAISDPRHNTKRFVVIRNDKIVYERGGSEPHFSYSASKGLLGAPTLVYALSKCGVGLNDPAARWLGHGEGARWNTESPWTDITVEHLATHTSGICDYGNPNAPCHDGNPDWQRAFDIANGGGDAHVYPDDAFTIARVQAEQNTEPAAPPGTVYEYSNVGHALLNYVVQRACNASLADIFDRSIRQPGMGSPLRPATIQTDEGQVFNQSAGTALWDALDGAAVLRLAGRLGIWDNRNVEPVRYWREVTKVEGNLPAAQSSHRGVIYEINSSDTWTQSPGYLRLSAETFGHGGNYSTLFLNDPLTGTIVARQGENNGDGASYLTLNGCAPGWTGMAPRCAEGTDWSNNWDVAGTELGGSRVGPRKMIVEPLQQAFFFPPPFCRMTAVENQPVDHLTDTYAGTPGSATVELTAEIMVDPREGAGSSVPDRIEFYKEGDATGPTHIGDGTLVEGTNPAQYRLSYDAESHGLAGEAKTYFANCVARSTQDPTRQVPSYSRPVRVRR